ncbi:MAG: TraB/GumN family protein [Planctomycetaceae bacterium]
MMKYRRSRFSHFKGVLIAIALMSTCQQAGSAAEKQSAKKKTTGKHFLWVVKSKTATVYLLGSVHVAKKEIYPLDDVIETAFKKSDTLVLEIPMDLQSQLEASQKLVAAGRYTGEDSLEKHLPEKVLKALKATLKKRKIPAEAFNRFKPWMVSILMTMQELMKSGFSASQGIDQHFYRRAKDTKRILALETVDDQVKMLSGLPLKNQVEMLRKTLEELDEIGKTISQSFDAWKRGDVKRLDDLLMKSAREPEYKPVYKAMFLDRNVKMTQKIQGYLKTKGTYFVVVGSGHLIGKGGIVDLLRKAKWTVEQL